MRDDMWVWCPDCQRLCMAKKSFGKIVCQECGDRLSDLNFWECPDCGRTIHAPGDKINQLSCPCGYTPSKPNQSVPEPESQPVSELQTDSLLQLTCTTCGADLESENGEYVCPVCGRVYGNKEIKRKSYLENAEKSISIFWDNAGMKGHLIYVHPHSQKIPAKSALIVGTNQGALYQSGGIYRFLEAGTYSLFWNEKKEQDLLQSLPFGEVGIPVQLNTKIIFFDTRGMDMEYRVAEKMQIHGTDYAYCPYVRYKAKIKDPEELMSNAFNHASYADEEALQELVVKWLEEAIYRTLRDQIAVAYDEGFTPGFGDIKFDLEQSLRKKLNPEFVKSEINTKLDYFQRGIEIAAIDIDGSIVEKEEIPLHERISCPHCNQILRKQEGRFNCKHCGEKIWICAFCGNINGYVNGHASSVCSSCGRRGN